MNIIPLKLSVTTCFLVTAGDLYVLIDTGYEDDWDLFQRRLSECRVELSQICHIILTHHHNDHCGLLRNILWENDSIRVVMSQQCKDLLLKGKNDLYRVGFLNGRIALLMTFGLVPYLSWRLKKVIPVAKLQTFPAYRLRNSDIAVTRDTGLREFGIPLDGKIMETPGHTADSISILFDNGDCLIGDAASNEEVMQFLGAKYCADVITDMDAVYKSWEKIIAAGALWIYPAHGSPFTVNKLIRNIGKNKAENLVPYPS
jgi:hydroxyacylglutathione hydrolase